MKNGYAISLVGLALLCLHFGAFGQQIDRIPYRQKKVQFSTFPGISTAGFESARYTYNFSFNLVSGMTAGTRFFALSSITNLSTRKSSGIQLAGLANIIGSQSYLHLTNAEQKELEEAGVTPNQQGIQLAGALNLVRGESSGIQITPGMNAVYRNSSGFHLAGFGNYAEGNMIGVQLGGFYNVTGRLVMGTQVGGINGAGSRLSGVQIGVFNKAKYIEGKADNSSVKSFGLQVGLINHSKTNNGIQIGLINRAKRMRGVQVGLINFFTPSPYDGANLYNGVPIGLLNFGSTDSKLRVYTSPVMPFMVEYTSGNCHNCTFTESTMPLGDIFYKTNQNAIIAGYAISDEDPIQWAFGYGFQRVYYYKNSMSPHDPKNKKYFFSPSIRFIHLNRTKKFDKTLSLLTQLQFEVGCRIRWVAFFAGANLNGYAHQTDSSLRVEGELMRGTGYQVWPGYVVGVQL